MCQEPYITMMMDYSDGYFIELALASETKRGDDLHCLYKVPLLRNCQDKIIVKLQTYAYEPSQTWSLCEVTYGK